MNNRPNILIIQSDQHRIDCIGAYGNSEIQTPHLDALSADGIRYQQSFCPYPVCTPSRYSFLSGLYVHQHMGRSNRSTLSPVIPTFPRVLCDAGYQTKAGGKMHFIPWGVDATFRGSINVDDEGRVYVAGLSSNPIFARRLYNLLTGQEKFIAAMSSLLNEVWNEAVLLDEIDR